jgi:Fatty acid cis/trans isomerase (CTI)
MMHRGWQEGFWMGKYRSFAVLAGALVLAVFASGYARAEPASAAPEAAPAGSYEAAQKLFNARCVQCHSCNNAPCQLKLTSYEGLQRGATKIKAIHPSRLKSIPPTRLGIDARSPAEWRRKGFFPVTGGKANLLISMINQGPASSPASAVADSRTCPANASELGHIASSHPEKLMPYGLPPLTPTERGVLASWVQGGRKPPVAKPQEKLPAEQALAKDKWEEFLNRRDAEHKLVARYLYEHLFLGSLHFSKDSTRYYRIIRSRTACNQPLDEIASRRPSDDPKADFHYCFEPARETIVEKTLLPYTLDRAKLDRVAGLFFDPRQPWKAPHNTGYPQSDAANPFVLYRDIPVKARYRFLLDDAQYHVGTFIKGPVCYGAGAVSSIDEHLFVFFMKPDSELMVADPEFAKASEFLLVLPYADGSDASILEDISLDKIWTAKHGPLIADKYISARNKYMALKKKHRAAAFKQGYRMTDLWDGGGTNPNAVLTVFRHFDHSYVLQGLRGGEASSYFVLDYGLLERLVYNLVVGFDVFGNLSHQLHTRLYMEMLRREAEDNFLLFLPPAERVRLRDKWYQKELAKLGRRIFYDPDEKSFPARIAFRSSNGTGKELVQKLGAEYFSPAVRGPYTGAPHSEYPPLEAMAGRPAGQAPFVKLFPDTSLILIEAGGKVKKVVTVIRDRAHSSLGRFVLESLAREPEQDRLAVIDGLATSYPNIFFDVPEERLPDFLRELNRVNSPASARAFIKSWGVLKTNPDFWAISDRLHAYLRKLDPVEYGVMDYTRYGIWTEDGDWHG